MDQAREILGISSISSKGCLILGQIWGFWEFNHNVSRQEMLGT